MTQEAHEAFLIVRHTHDLLMAFEERLEPVNRPYYEALRRELTGDPGQYRGISRNPLLPLDYPDFACVSSTALRSLPDGASPSSSEHGPMTDSPASAFA